MSPTLSEADLTTIADQLFLLRSPAPVPLPKPTNTDDITDSSSLASMLTPIASDERFKEIGIGVVDFTSDVMAPRVWLHNENDAWRISSTGKIALLLAAVQLRDDVRKVQVTGLISTPDEFDSIFSKIWRRARGSRIRQIAEEGSSPRISTIFDLAKTPVDFIGADTPLDRTKLSNIGDVELRWSGVPDLTFWERLWLAGAQSDNVAASSCISEIGVAYMKSLQHTYGLFDPTNGMHLLLAGGYKAVSTTTPVNNISGAPKYRPLRNTETNRVKDKFHDSNRTTQSGSSAALTAYMIALMQDTLVDSEGCDTIRLHLADQTAETGETATSLIFQGVSELETVNKAHTKLGILGSLRCEFAYLETGSLKYAVLATGILPKRVGLTGFSQGQQGRDLGKAIHTALSGP